MRKLLLVLVLLSIVQNTWAMELILWTNAAATEAGEDFSNEEEEPDLGYSVIWGGLFLTSAVSVVWEAMGNVSFGLDALQLSSEIGRELAVD